MEKLAKWVKHKTPHVHDLTPNRQKGSHWFTKIKTGTKLAKLKSTY